MKNHRDHPNNLAIASDTVPLKPAINRNDSFLAKFTTGSWAVLIISAICQCVFFPSFENFSAVLCVTFSWAIITYNFIKKDQFNTFPLSTFLVLGFAVTQLYFPLVFTLLESKPIIFNLELPYQVFFHSFVALLVIVLAHKIYRSINYGPKSSLTYLLNKSGLYESPKDLQLWMMGLLGLSAMFYIYFYSPSVGHEVTGAFDKLIQGFVTFTYAPFFIPFGKLYGRKGPVAKRLMPMLIIFTVLLFAVSLGRNSRGAFMLGFASVGFAYGLGLLLGTFKSHLFTVKNVLVGGLALWLFTGPIADLGTAMVLVRAQRNDISRSDLITNTLQAYQDKEAIQLIRLAGKTEKRDWDENYMDNIFLARFCNIKYNDASLIMAAKLGEQNGDIFNFSLDRLMATLPDPLITNLQVNVDKKTVNSASFGDYMYFKAGAGETSLGAFRTGHFAGTGMAAFGWWYLLLLGVGMIPVFALFDKLFIRKTSFTTLDQLQTRKEARFSLCGLLSLYAIFTFLYEESVISIASFIMRGWIQKVFLYLLLYHLTRLIINLLPIPKTTKRTHKSPWQVATFPNSPSNANTSITVYP